MNICIKHSNRNNYSIKIKVIYNGISRIIGGLYIDSEAHIKYNFKDSNEYIIVISVVENGIQTFKNRYKFVYHECDEYRLDDKVKIKKGLRENKIVNKSIINNLKDKVSINPLISYRDEDEIVSIFNNGNIILLKGNLKKIFLRIITNKALDELELSEDEVINSINTLIMKGCVISYE